MNTWKKGVGLEIIKVDINTLDSAEKTYLEGAEFTVTRLDPDRHVSYAMTPVDPEHPEAGNDYVYRQKVVTDSSGKVNVNGLISGYYEIKETKAPDGYNMLPEPYYIKVDTDKWTITLIEKTTVDDPATDIDERIIANWPPLNLEDSNLIRFKQAKQEVKADPEHDIEAQPEEGAELTIGNTPGMALPSTGGKGYSLFTALGITLILTAGSVLSLKTWRRKKED